MVSHAQGDTINQRDQEGLKQGRWIYYGVDLPEYDYPDSAIYKEGTYIDDRKEGLWTKYDRDGSVLIQMEFKSGLPYSQNGFREYLRYGYSSCEKSIYDSIHVRYRSVNSYGPIIDTSIVLYPDSGEFAKYVDSLSTLDTTFQSNQMIFCSHFRDITIKKFVGSTHCMTLFSDCSGNHSKPAKIARECAFKVFGMGRLED